MRRSHRRRLCRYRSNPGTMRGWRQFIAQTYSMLYCIGAYWTSKAEALCNGGQYNEFKGKECIVAFTDYIEELAKYIHKRNTNQTRVPAMKKYDNLVVHDAATSCIWCKNVFMTMTAC